jgi:hypothetical protein
MSNMNIPGFTAEISLYKTDMHDHLGKNCKKNHSFGLIQPNMVMLDGVEVDSRWFPWFSGGGSSGGSPNPFPDPISLEVACRTWKRGCQFQQEGDCKNYDKYCSRPDGGSP